jgi:hypothetical protein
MELSAYEIALISGGFGIAGTLIGVLGTYRLSLQLAEKQFSHLREISKIDAWHVAANSFTVAFSEELARLESGETITVPIDEFLLNAFERKHKVAIATFEHFIPSSKRPAFIESCKQYHSGNKQVCDGLGFSYKDAMFSEYIIEQITASGADPYKLAAQRIRAILEFAKY